MRNSWILFALVLSGCTTAGGEINRETACTNKHGDELKALGDPPTSPSSVDPATYNQEVRAYNKWTRAYDKEVDAYNACLKAR